jgi:hypothetical protein
LAKQIQITKMKDKFLKMAGVKSEKEFYNMFPTEEAFFKAYPQAVEMKSGGNVPTNPGLYSRVKSEAKSKFDTWPSAYGSAWLVKTYKSRGGGYRKAQTGGGLQDQQIFQYPNYDQNMMAYMQKAQQDEQNNPMGAIGDMLYNGAMAIGKNVDNAAQNMGGGSDNGGGDKMQMAKLAMNLVGMPAMQMGGTGMMMRDNYYDEGGEMAIGQIMAMHDRLSNLQKFVNADSEIEPWVASKITLADDYLNSVSDYMQYNEESGGIEEEEDADMNMGEMEQMKMGGIPQRYKSRGFTKVGAKRKSDRAGKKWMVLAKKGDKYKIVHGGYVGMKDFSQHGSNKRKDNFWNRMGGKNSAKATDPFSPLYWHKRFGTWAQGGQPEEGGPVKEVPFKAITDAEDKKARNKKALDIGEIAASIAGTIGMIAADARLARGKNRYYSENPQHNTPDPTTRQKWDMGKRAYGGTNNPGFQALPEYVQAKILSNMAEGGDIGSAPINTFMSPGVGSDPRFEQYYNRQLQDLKSSGVTGVKDMPSRNDIYSYYQSSNPQSVTDQTGRMIFSNPKGNISSGTTFSQAVDPNTGMVLNQGTNLEKTAFDQQVGRFNYGGSTDMYGGQMDMDAMYNMMKGGNMYQQGGQGQVEDQIMQAIQMYAQMTQTDPQQIIKQLQAMSPEEQQQAIQQIMQAIQQGQSPQMAYGGININPANKGKFTASANRAGMGVQEFASKVLANKEDYSSTQVKRANFARNAAGWKKQMGGMTEGQMLELDDNEIQNLISQGYGIEYLD